MNKKLLEKILSDNSLGNFSAKELTAQLNSELAKESPDYDLVDELTAAILEAKGESAVELDVEAEISRIKAAESAKRRRFHCPKWAVAAAAVFVFFIGANTVSVAAWGKNIVSAVIEFTKGGFSVDFGEQETIELPVSEDDPFGIIAECAKYDIYPETPHYLPEGFELVDFCEDVSDTSTDLCFYYKCGEVKLDFIFSKYNDSQNIPPTGIPSDHFNITEQEINGHNVIISKEDNQFTATFTSNAIVYVIFADGLDYGECQTVLDSFK